MTLNPSKVIQSLADENELKQPTNWVRGKVFRRLAQVFFYRFFFFFFPRMTEEKVFRCNIICSVLLAWKETLNLGRTKRLSN